MEQEKKIYKYEEIVTYIISSIDNGSIKKGAKLPSLRKICRQFACSMSVAMQAYSELEMQGIAVSVEKSGFFVSSPSVRDIPLPEKEHYSLKTTVPKSKSIVAQVIDLSNDEKVISLGAAIPDKSILPVNKLNKIITKNAKENPNLLCAYTPGKGNLSLRKALTSFLFKRGISVNQEDIIITNGCIEALSLAIRATTKEGDIIAIENPVFFGLINLLRELKRKVIEIPTSPEHGMNLDVLDDVASKNDIKVCLVSASFQNPLSFVMPKENKRRILAIAKERNFTIIEDDIYSEIGFRHNLLHRSITSYAETDNIIYCSSFSKSIAPGMRIGWMLPNKYMQACENMKFSESLGGVALLQEAMADFLNEGGYDYFIKKFCKKLARQMYEIKDAVIDAFPSDIKISNPEGGYFLWIELAKGVDTQQLFLKAAKKGVCIVPGGAFTTTGRYKNCIRISCAAPFTENTLKAIKILGQLIS